MESNLNSAWSLLSAFHTWHHNFQERWYAVVLKKASGIIYPQTPFVETKFCSFSWAIRWGVIDGFGFTWAALEFITDCLALPRGLKSLLYPPCQRCSKHCNCSLKKREPWWTLFRGWCSLGSGAGWVRNEGGIGHLYWLSWCSTSWYSDGLRYYKLFKV